MNRVAELRAAMSPEQTREDLARVVGCSGEQIRKIEGGFDNPGIVMARKIAKALNASLDEVFPAETPRKKGRAA